MKDFAFFYNFTKKKVDGMARQGDNYNRIVGNRYVANVIVGIEN